jgi:hypothetical protein
VPWLAIKFHFPRIGGTSPETKYRYLVPENT